MKRFIMLLCAAALVAGLSVTAFGQHTILINMDGDEYTLDLGNGLLGVGTCGEDEVYSVTPTNGFYSARTFMSRAGQWAFVGDADNDGRFADDSTLAPGKDMDAIFVRAGDAGPFGPRDVFVSKEDVTGMATGFADGDVFRYAGPGGVLEVFVTEAMLISAVGGSSSWDTNAICQSSSGDLFLSTSTTNGGFDDGDIVYIPAGSITYDVNGNVSAITPGSALLLAPEAELETVILASGFKTSTGGDAATSLDLSALEIDPNGGTWTPASNITVPNLLFAWDGYSNDGGIISTAGGGQIAVINGVAMGSTVATQGTQIGLLPDSTGLGGLQGLGLIPEQAPLLVVENYPVDLHTSTDTGASWHMIEVGSATPSGTAFSLIAIGPPGPGGVVPSIPTVQGEFFIGLLYLKFVPITTDGDGFGSFDFVIPPTPGLPGVNIIFQVIDLPTLDFSTPAAVQFI